MALLQKGWLWITAVSLLILTVVGVVLISIGTFDPKPIGRLQRSIAPGRYHIDAGSTHVQWLDLPIDEVGSVRGTAVYVTGEQDIIYGLTIGEIDHYVRVVVSPLGYVAVAEIVNGQPLTGPFSSVLTPHALVTFQPWPHVRTGKGPNEIWVDWANGQLTIRINREVLWVGSVAIDPVAIGIVGGSFGETAVVDFQLLDSFHPIE